MATLRERKPGVWEIRVFTGSDSRGRPTQLSRTIHGGKREAQRVAVEMEAGGRVSSGGRLISDVLDAWVAQSLDTWAPSSVRDQESRVRSIKKDQIARLPVARLSIGDAERWHTRMRRAGLGDAGVKNLHGVLRAALAQAVRWGWVSANVAGMARLRSTKTPHRTVMTLEEVRAVLDAATTIDPAAALMLRIAAVSGARRAELAALRWTDLRDGRLTIDSAIEIVSSDDGVREFRDAATKTANTRTVTLDPDTVTAIEELRAQREQYGPWMFGLGPELVSPDRIGWWWKRARTLAGIAGKWRLHDLRHWSATVAIGQGHDVRTVAGRLGHANPAMTLRVYAHAFAAADQAVAAGLGDLLKPSNEMSGRFRPTDAFVDESMRGQRYLMACVLIEARQLTDTRRRVEQLGVSGARIHFNNESRRQKVKVLDAIAAMPLEVLAVVCHRRHGVTELQARSACLEVIVARLQDQSVGRLVIESRQDDRADQRTIHAARRPQPRLVFEHRLGAREPMLWAADAVAWTVGAGDPWLPRVERRLSDIVDLRP